MKKILNVIGSLKIGGAENNAMTILRELNRQAFEYHFLVFDPEEGDLEAEAKQLGAIIHRLPAPKQGYAKFIRNFRQLLAKENFQGIHVNTLWNSGLLLKIAKDQGIPLRICHSHSTQSSANEYILYKIYKGFMKKWIQSYATHYIACGQAAGEYLYGEKFFNQYGQIIYNAIDLDKFQFSENTRQLMREKLAIDSNQFVLGHTGRLAPVKNHPFMVHLLKKLLDRGHNTVLILIGDGPNQEKIAKQVRELDLEDKVHFLGKQNNIHQWLQAMDLFLFPSFFEGFPVSLVEAQATGLPCLISDQVSPEALLTDHSLALPLSQPEAWIRQIEDQISVPWNRKQTKLTRIQTSFDIHNVIHQWEALYNEA